MGRDVPELGPQLQRLRKEQGLTLEQLAMSSNVSKSMLSQIERGQTNPTFATLWNLTRALKVEIADLMVLHSPKVGVQLEHVQANMTPMMKSPDGRCTLRILSPVTSSGEVEWYELIFEGQGALESQAHAPGTMEHLTCLRGTLLVRVDGVECQLQEGDSLRYPADVVHRIQNRSASRPARALLVVVS